MRKTCGAVIVAAGSARRMGGIDKIMTPLGGVPLLLQTVRALSASNRLDTITVVTRAELVDAIKALCAGEEKVHCVLAGGETRAQSVLCGLKTLQTELAAIHDGARPLVPLAVIDAAISAAEADGAAAPAIPVHDTIKVAQNGVVLQTPERSTLFAVQTPQVFARELILAALQEALRRGLPLTDDCSAAEAAGARVVLTPGSEENLKITVPTDLTLAQAILDGRKL